MALYCFLLVGKNKSGFASSQSTEGGFTKPRRVPFNKKISKIEKLKKKKFHKKINFKEIKLQIRVVQKTKELTR